MVDDKLSEKYCRQTNNEGEKMIESFDVGKRVRNHTLATTGIVLATYILIYCYSKV